MPVSLFTNRRFLTLICVFLLFVIWVVFTYSKFTTHGLSLSPDSYIYLDTALNISEGRGIVHSFVMTNQLNIWDNEKRYIPMNYWAPGFSLLIVLAHKLFGYSSFPSASEICVWLAFIGTTSIVFFQTSRFWGVNAGIWSFILILLLYPISYVYSWVWSDGIVIPFTLGSLWLLTEQKKFHKVTSIFSGILAGLAFSIRYIHGLLLPLGFFIILTQQIFFESEENMSNQGKFFPTKYYKVLATSFLFTTGWAICAIPIFARNLIVTGSIFGLPRPQSDISLWQNIKLTFSALSTNWIFPKIIPNEIQGSLLVALFFFIILIIVVQRKYSILKEYIKHHLVFIHFIWAVSYLIVIIIYTSFYQIDVISHRLLFPFTISIIILFSGLFERVFPLPYWLMVVFSSLSIFLFTLLYPIASENYFTTENLLNDNPRLQWVCSETQPNDWIIGDSTFDITLGCGHRRSLCFIPTSDKEGPPNEQTLFSFLNRIKSKEARVFILLRKGVPLEEAFFDQWKKYYGNVIAHLVFDSEYKYIKTKNRWAEKSFVALEIEYNPL